MLQLDLPLAHQNPRFRPGTKITAELAVIAPRGPKTVVAWKSITVSFPVMTAAGESFFTAGIPDGEAVVLAGPAVSTLFKYDVHVPAKIEDPSAYPPGTLVFNKLCGAVETSHAGTLFMYKWRFVYPGEHNEKTVSPWSCCYQARTLPTESQDLTPGQKVIIPELPAPPPEPEYCPQLFCRSSCDAFVPATNLDFVLGVCNKGDKEFRDVILQAVVKPTPGVDLEIISMEEASVVDPSCRVITGHNPVVFTYYHRNILPRTEPTHHIIVKILQAPVGVSLVSTTVKMFLHNNETLSEKCTATIKISPLPDIRETQKNILSSLARTEAGMADILQAEAEKISRTSILSPDVPGITKVNESVQDTLRNLIKYQILQELKLEDALRIDQILK